MSIWIKYHLARIVPAATNRTKNNLSVEAVMEVWSSTADDGTWWLMSVIVLSETAASSVGGGNNDEGE